MIGVGLALGGCAGAGEDAVSPTPSSTVSVAARELPVVGQSVTAEAEPSGSPDDEAADASAADAASADEESASGDSSGDDGASEGDAESGESGDESVAAAANGLSGSLSKRAEQLAKQLFDLANEARADADVDDLEWADCAADQAEKRAARARGLDELEHQQLAFDCTGELVGENLVRGDAPASNLHQLWMDSKGHKENILNEDFDRLGIGCVAHAVGDRTSKAESAEDIGGWVCSQMFYG